MQSACHKLSVEQWKKVEVRHDQEMANSERLEFQDLPHQNLPNKTEKQMKKDVERSSVVVEYRTPNRDILGSIPTGSSMLCPYVRHINSPEY